MARYQYGGRVEQLNVAKDAGNANALIVSGGGNLPAMYDKPLWDNTRAVVTDFLLDNDGDGNFTNASATVPVGADGYPKYFMGPDNVRPLYTATGQRINPNDIGSDTVVVPAATEAVAGIGEISNNAETDAGVNNITFISPAKLQRKIDSHENDVDAHPARWEQIDNLATAVADKLDKDPLTGLAYLAQLPAADGATPDTLVLRRATGGAAVGTATQDDEAVPLLQVTSLIAAGAGSGADVRSLDATGLPLSVTSDATYPGTAIPGILVDDAKTGEVWECYYCLVVRAATAGGISIQHKLQTTAVTNLLANPSFDVNTANWAINSTHTLTRDTSVTSQDGTGHAKIVAGSTVTYQFKSEWIPCTPGETFSAGAYFRLSAGTAKQSRCDIEYADAAGVNVKTVLGTQVFPGSGAWTRSLAQGDTIGAPSTATQVRVRIAYVTPVVADACVHRRRAVGTGVDPPRLRQHGRFGCERTRYHRVLVWTQERCHHERGLRQEVCGPVSDDRVCARRVRWARCGGLDRGGLVQGRGTGHQPGRAADRARVRAAGVVCDCHPDCCRVRNVCEGAMSRGRTINLVRRARITYHDQPAAPEAPVPSNITQTGVTLSWPPVADADWYRLEMALAGSGNWALSRQGAALTKDVDALTAATDYDFRLAAFSGGATGVRSDWSATTTVTTLTSSSPPTTPAAPTASNVTATTATLTAVAVAGQTSNGWQRSATSGTTGFADIAGTGLSINDSGLTPETPYWYRVRAENADGPSAYSTATQITTLAQAQTVPARPNMPFVIATSPTSIQFGWDPVPTADEYQAQHSPTGAQPWNNVYIGANLEGTKTGLAPGTNHWFRVIARNEAGDSPAYSPELQTATPLTGANVQPVSARTITSRAGVCAHPNFNTAVWQTGNADAFCQRAKSQGFAFIRGMVSFQAVADVWADACRANGLKWLMTSVPEGADTTTYQTVPETIAKIQMIESRYADICYGLEGINEPNHNRGSGVPPVNWADITVNHQRAIWNTAKAPGSALADVIICGPSVHDDAADKSYTDTNPLGGQFHHHQLVEAGIMEYQDEIGLHTYPGGSFPIRKLDLRLEHMYEAYGANYPVFCTEHGWHNALNPALGHKPITEAGAGTYGPRGILQFLSLVRPNGIVRGPLRYTYYSGLDNPDTGAPTVPDLR